MSDAARLAALVRAIAEHRDRCAFGELFQWAAPRLRAWLRRRGAPDTQVDELLQEIMLTVWRQAERYDPARASVAAWIFTLARNKHVDRVRRERRPPPAWHEVHGGQGEPSPHRLTAALRQRERLLAAVAQLPEDQAAVIRSTFLDEQSQRETAAAHGVPLGTVKSRTRLAFGRLRAMLSSDAPE